MLLVRSYRTFAPLPVRDNAPSAVCFCGTFLAVARTGRYPAGLVFRESGLSSDGVAPHPQLPRRLPLLLPVYLRGPVSRYAPINGT